MNDNYKNEIQQQGKRYFLHLIGITRHRNNNNSNHNVP